MLAFFLFLQEYFIEKKVFFFPAQPTWFPVVFVILAAVLNCLLSTWQHHYTFLKLGTLLSRVLFPEWFPIGFANEKNSCMIWKMKVKRKSFWWFWQPGMNPQWSSNHSIQTQHHHRSLMNLYFMTMTEAAISWTLSRALCFSPTFNRCFSLMQFIIVFLTLWMQPSRSSISLFKFTLM